MMLESRLILNVTVLASEPLDDLSNGHTLEHRMGGPKALASPPAGHDGAASFRRLLTPEYNFVLVTSFDIISICSLGGFSHDYDSFYFNFKLRLKYLRRVTFYPTRSNISGLRHSYKVPNQSVFDLPTLPSSLEESILSVSFSSPIAFHLLDQPTRPGKHLRRNRHADLLRRL